MFSMTSYEPITDWQKNMKKAVAHFMSHWPSLFSVTIVLSGALCGVTTYLILTGLTPITPTPTILYTLLVTNLIFVVSMLGLVIHRLYKLYQQRKQGQAGAQLHSHLVSLFAFIAIVPAILVAIFAFVTLDQGLDRWFGERTKAIINNTSMVANAYLDEHRQNLRRDAIVMANDLNRAAPAFTNDTKRFHSFLTAQAALRTLTMALIIDRKGTVLDMVRPRGGQINLPAPPPKAFAAADKGHYPVIITASEQAQVRALIKLDKFDNAYLYVMRLVDSRVLEHLVRTDVAVKAYTEFENRRFETQLTFALVYIGISLVILLSAIWFGLWLAKTLASPIGQLIIAAQRVSQGDLAARVKTETGVDEIKRLGKTFNKMTEQLVLQRKELTDARDDLDIRHQFTEMVLSGVSSGVIGIDPEGFINHANMLAQEICGKTEEQMVGRSLLNVFPALSELLEKVGTHQNINFEVELKDDDGMERVLLVRIAEGKGKQSGNLVLTFDDITSFLSAKRTAAWADIARRIAHEIKNPLTPIQLSAERLKAKYHEEVSEPEVFLQCTETIIRQVTDIGHMVDEFSSFARMPSAVFKKIDAYDVLTQAVFLQRVAHPEIEYEIENKNEGRVYLMADRRLLSQALTNILKNAAESIQGHTKRTEQKILVSVMQNESSTIITISDTGVGLPTKNRHKLVEAYVTTREKGTGLGLAIAKKVMEDHAGQLILEDAPWVSEGKSGAQIILKFPYMRNQKAGEFRVEEKVV